MPSRRETAVEFLQRFCAGDLDGLARLIAPTLIFRGPLHASDTAQAYLASLRASPPKPARYRNLNITVNAKHVALFYDYLKGDSALQIAQLFHIPDREIEEIIVVFDTRDLT